MEISEEESLDFEMEGKKVNELLEEIEEEINQIGRDYFVVNEVQRLLKAPKYRKILRIYPGIWNSQHTEQIDVRIYEKKRLSDQMEFII
jgi:hypothetical protein